MLRWFGDFLASSIGKKIVLALTGLLLVGFLVEHLYGNLKLYEDGSGAAFDGYVAELQSFGWLLAIAELGLGALFACHVYLAIRLTLENREARSIRYTVRNTRGAATFGSTTMFVTGLNPTKTRCRRFTSPATASWWRIKRSGNGCATVPSAVFVAVAR